MHEPGANNTVYNGAQPKGNHANAKTGRADLSDGYRSAEGQTGINETDSVCLLCVLELSISNGVMPLCLIYI
jgi:hypothetical protein